MSRADFDRARTDVDFQLGYQRAPEPREFNDGGLSGPDLDDAFRPGGTSDGEWAVPDWEYDADDAARGYRDWIIEMFATAFAEATHEVMEWFHVNGRPLVNPHGHGETDIIERCQDLARTIAVTYGRKPDDL